MRSDPLPVETFQGHRQLFEGHPAGEKEGVYPRNCMSQTLVTLVSRNHLLHQMSSFIVLRPPCPNWLRVLFHVSTYLNMFFLFMFVLLLLTEGTISSWAESCLLLFSLYLYNTSSRGWRKSVTRTRTYLIIWLSQEIYWEDTVETPFPTA